MGRLQMNNKPIAWMYNYENFPDSFVVCRARKSDQDIPLYTHPVKELNDGGEPVKNATYWKRQYNLMATQNDNLKSGLYHANEQIKYLESQIEALKIKLVEAIDAEKDRRFE